MMQFMAKQNTACSDASACAPAACAASACTTDTAAIRMDMAILAVSFFIIAAVSICLSVLGLRGLLVLLVLAWGLVIMVRIIADNFKSAKSNGEMNLAAAAR